MTTFTPKETGLLHACFKYMNVDITTTIDFTKVATTAGYQDAKAARTMFLRLKKAKLSSIGDTTVAASTKTPTMVTSKRKASKDLAKPAAKQPRAAKAADTVDENLGDDEEGTDKSEEAGQEADETLSAFF